MEGFNSFSRDIISGEHEMSGIFNGSTTFFYLQCKDEAMTRKYRMHWVINNYFGDEFPPDEDVFSCYMSNSGDNFKICEKGSEGTNCMEIKGYNEKVQYMMENIGSFYKEFANIYKKKDEPDHIEEYNYEEEEEAYATDEYEDYDSYDDYTIEYEDYSEEEY